MFALSTQKNKFSPLLVVGVFFGLLVITTKLYAETIPVSFQQCVACHGQQGQGNQQLNAPALAGQSVSYLTRQLNNFSSGLRGAHSKDLLGQQMTAIAKQLNKNIDIAQLANYINRLPTSRLVKAVEGNLKNGSRYYQAKCGACHGGQAQGNEAFSAPKLQGLSRQYLNRQMENFVSGIRGTDKQDKFGRQMAMMAKTTSGQELKDIMYFIAIQEVPEK